MSNFPWQLVLGIIAGFAFFYRRQKFSKEDVELAKSFDKAKELQDDQTKVDTVASGDLAAFEKLRTKWYEDNVPRGLGSRRASDPSPEAADKPTGPTNQSER